MHVQVSLIIEIEATASITEMEQHIQEVGQQAMREAMKQAIRHGEDQQQACPHCGGMQRRLEGTVRRRLATTFGRVVVPRRRFRCQGCGQRWCPATSLWRRTERRNHQPAVTRSSHARGLFVAVSRSSQPAQAAQWSPDQCRRNPAAHQPGRQAARHAKASRGRAGLLLSCPSRSSS